MASVKNRKYVQGVVDKIKELQMVPESDKDTAINETIKIAKDLGMRARLYLTPLEKLCKAYNIPIELGETAKMLQNKEEMAKQWKWNRLNLPHLFDLKKDLHGLYQNPTTSAHYRAYNHTPRYWGNPGDVKPCGYYADGRKII